MQKRYRTGGLGRETRRLAALLHAAEARYTPHHDTPSLDLGKPHPRRRRAGRRGCAGGGRGVVETWGGVQGVHTAGRLKAPFSGPAFTALEFVPGALAGVTGEARYPPPFGLE